VTERVKALKLPVLRGVVMLFETLVNGYQALSYSAAQALEDPPPKDGEPKPAKGEGKQGELVGWALTGTMVFAMAAGIGLFVLAPHLVTAYLNPRLGISASVSSGSFHLVDGAVKLTILVAYLFLVSRL